jgi:hypothetical protein
MGGKRIAPPVVQVVEMDAAGTTAHVLASVKDTDEALRWIRQQGEHGHQYQIVRVVQAVSVQRIQVETVRVVRADGTGPDLFDPGR